ncbi:MAG: hypothetical protein DI598_12030 [Pseudopedobacter saltans]|uniref:Macroglobulin domain-containing protein n=1 Tax=Pseudopedobacter saltans TaxID=151895 RepID=A0A2W5GL34_9SPHI|nr:MAG: hypothetical protein DI598_12030 [Pseudopedobacter saltans]
MEMKVIVILILSLFFGKVFCQNTTNQQILYVATDKDIYTNNETIWFAGYILNDIHSPHKTDILTICLIETKNNSIVLQKKYMMNLGLCAGSLVLPDSIASGTYQFYAFTNLVDKDSVPFGQYKRAIEVKSFSKNSFLVNYELSNKLTQSDSINLSIRISPEDPVILQKIQIEYEDSKGKMRRLKLDGQSHYTFSLPQDKISKTNIHFKASYIGEHQEDFIPVVKEKPIISESILGIYPEGGQIVNNTLNSIVWEYKKPPTGASTQPIKALLLENEKLIDTVEADKWGIGRFIFLPRNNNSYTLKILDSSIDKSVKLPNALDYGIATKLSKVVVDDTLTVELSEPKIQKVFFRISNVNTDSSTTSILLSIENKKRLKIPLYNVVRGLNTITIFDSLGRPLSEHLFFAHYTSKLSASLSTDSLVYNTRSPIKVTVQLTDKESKIKAGIFSISCVQKNRLSKNYTPDMASYYFLGSLMDSLDNVTNDSSLMSNNLFLTDMLLTRGWRKYTWLSNNAKVEKKEIKKIQLMGQVLKNKKQLKKPEAITLIGPWSPSFISTDSSGSFVMEAEKTVMEENRKSLLFLNNHFSDMSYSMKLDTTFQTIAQLNKNFIPFKKNTTNKQQVDSIQDISNNYAKDVVVKSSYNNNFFQSYQKNDCGDYVCQYNILNCPNHPWGGTLPVKGQTYGRPGGGSVVYVGCETRKNGINMDGIYTARQFYGMDSIARSQATTENLSTIYWNPFVMVDSTGKAQLIFYSSDYKDYYDIVIQGLTDSDFFYSKKRIKVE